MPSLSVLSLDLEFCIILHISPGLMVPRWRSWELLGERKDSGEMGESGLSEGERYMDKKDDLTLLRLISMVRHSNILGMNRERLGMILKVRESFT